MAIRNASARWTGTLIEGNGVLRTGKGRVGEVGGGYEGPYSFSSRFEEGEGTNPEELIGAAHAGCYSMFLSKVLTDAGHPPISVETTAKVHLEKTDAGQSVTQIELDTAGEVPGIDAAEFTKHAEAAKSGCPISRLLAPGTTISLTARLA